MKTCVFLTMDSLDDYCCYDHLLYAPMNELGWNVEEISWRAEGVDWGQYDVVLIRSPWDYMFDPDGFIKVLEDIDKSGAHLENSLNIAKWNIEKTYLKDMEKKGVPCIPTLWRDRFDAEDGRSFFDALGVDEIIIKPVLSAGAKNTYRLHVSVFEEKTEVLQSDFSSRAFMVQPFLESIIDPGEYSLFYFGGEYSHAIQKKPKENDFRVQEEHGGILSKIDPDAGLLDSASQALGFLDEVPLYARIDLVPYKDKSVLIEMELIEPSLYFNLDEDAPMRFARAFDMRMRALR